MKEKQKRGFAGMDIEKRRRIASMGGKAAHKQGVAHTWTKETASLAGKKGGLNGGKSKKKKLNEV